MADTIIPLFNASTAVIISDFIFSPHAKRLYTTIKDRIINTFAESTETRLKRLLQEQVINDGKPSQLLVHMRNLAGLDVNDTIL